MENFNWKLVVEFHDEEGGKVGMPLSCSQGTGATYFVMLGNIAIQLQ